MFARISRNIIFVLSFLFIGSAIAEEIKADTFLAKDRYEVGGRFQFSSQAKSGATNFSLTPNVGYFIKDRISINGLLNTQYSGISSKVFGYFGLGASYYFKLEQQFAPFVSQNFTRTYGNSDAIMGGSTDFGVLNFLAPNVAFKTALEYNYNFKQSMNEGLFSLYGAFSIYF